MVDRITKIDQKLEPWKVEEAAHARKDRHQEEKDPEDERKKKKDDSFQPDKTDWKMLLDSNSHWKRNITLESSEIAEIIFQKINLKTDPSLLKVTLNLTNGEIINEAFLTISRLVGFKLKNKLPGESIAPEVLGITQSLTVTIPDDGFDIREEKKDVFPTDEPVSEEDESTITHNADPSEATRFFDTRDGRKNTLPTDTARYEKVLLVTMAIIVAIVLVGFYIILR